MLSDRELDLLVATKVMGWQIGTNHRRHYWIDGTGVYQKNRSDYIPSRHPGLALEAAMKARGGLSVEIVPQSSGKFMVPREDIGDKPTYTYGSTLARALSLYALRAVGVEVDDDSAGRGE